MPSAVQVNSFLAALALCNTVRDPHDPVLKQLEEEKNGSASACSCFFLPLIAE